MDLLLCMPIPVEVVGIIVASSRQYLRKNFFTPSERFLCGCFANPCAPYVRRSPILPRGKQTGRPLAARLLFLLISKFNRSPPAAGLDSLCRRAADTHCVEGTVDEEEGDDEERPRENVRQAAALGGRQLHGELDGQQAEERREFNDGMSATKDVSLNGSPTVSPMTVASCSGVPFCLSSLQRSSGVVPAPPALAMKMAWYKPKIAMEKKVADEEKRSTKRKPAWRRTPR